MEGAARTWLAWRWWRSYLSPQDHIDILTTSNGSTTAARLRYHVLFICILVSLHMLIMLIVMWYLWKHVPYYLVDHGNLIKIMYTMVQIISILLFIRTKILL